MRRYLAVLPLFVIATVILVAQGADRGEMVGRPTDRSATITLRSSVIRDVCVEYGEAGGPLASRTPWRTAEANVMVDIELTDLRPDAEYVYRVLRRNVGSDEVVAGADRRFHTQRVPGRPYTFTIQADPHLDEQSDTTLYRRCLDNQLNDRPDLMFDLGDFLMSDKLRGPAGKVTRDTIVYRCELLRSFNESVNHSVPLYHALGNHEGEAGWLNTGTAENIPVWGTNARKEYFRNPEPDNFYSGDTTHYPFVGRRQAYYAFEWGDALFVVLDPYWFTRPKPDSLNGWRWTLGREQYDWLERTLRAKRARWTFVFAHQLVGGDPDGRGGVEFADRYEWGGQDLGGGDGFARQRPGWAEPIKDLLKRHRATIFFHGHDHFYAHQVKDCLVYQEVPQPSHPNVTSAGQADDYGYHEGRILPNSGHLRVAVSADRVRVEYVRAYLPSQETGDRRNGDVSAIYEIGPVTCYDSVSSSVPVIWNSAYLDEHVAPNPLRDRTSITFRVVRRCEPLLVIVDAGGRTVRRLLSGTALDPGDYTVQWDGRSDSGEELAAGAYRYVLVRADEGATSGTVVVTR